MTLGLIGKKVGMSQCFDENGALVPVTLVMAGPCTILQKKLTATDGYNALQLGFEAVRVKKKANPRRKPVSLAVAGHCKKAGVDPRRYIREVRVDDPSPFEVGQVLDLDIFEDGEQVDVVGASKGRGTQGVIKRFNNNRGPTTHGSKYHRRPGSMSASSFPSRVFKGKKLPGHMGAVRVTAQRLKIVKRDKENNLIAVKGSVPGAANGLVLIRKSTTARKNSG